MMMASLALLITFFLTRDFTDSPIPSMTPLPCDVGKYFHLTSHCSEFDKREINFT
jgi:hypothetical protein